MTVCNLKAFTLNFLICQFLIKIDQTISLLILYGHKCNFSIEVKLSRIRVSLDRWEKEVEESLKCSTKLKFIINLLVEIRFMRFSNMTPIGLFYLMEMTEPSEKKFPCKRNAIWHILEKHSEKHCGNWIFNRNALSILLFHSYIPTYCVCMCVYSLNAINYGIDSECKHIWVVSQQRFSEFSEQFFVCMRVDDQHFDL